MRAHYSYKLPIEFSTETFSLVSIAKNSSNLKMAEVSNEREIQPMQLSLEQLNMLKTQHEEEIQEMQRQLESLYSAKTRFNTAKATVQDISETSAGHKILIPLSSSLYVPGTICKSNKVGNYEI